MSIYRENDFDPENQSDHEAEILEPGKMMIQLNDETMEVALLLDKDGNPTEIFYDAHTVLCRPPGVVSGGWVEVFIQEGAWETPTFH